MTDSTAAPSLLDCRQIGVRFGGVVALQDVDFDIRPGEVHGLVGCNGAGKSTLMKVLAGVVPEYTGEIQIDGKPVRLHSPREALAQKIAMVYQELSGIGALSVAENLCLGRQPTTLGRVDWKRMNREAAASLAELDIQIDVRRRLDSFPLVIRQMVEIARGLHSGARVLILDEPTSALSLDGGCRRVPPANWTVPRSCIRWSGKNEPRLPMKRRMWYYPRPRRVRRGSPCAGYITLVSLPTSHWT
jgi:ribose transport system ATP-binding protein